MAKRIEDMTEEERKAAFLAEMRPLLRVRAKLDNRERERIIDELELNAIEAMEDGEAKVRLLIDYWNARISRITDWFDNPIFPEDISEDTKQECIELRRGLTEFVGDLEAMLKG